MGIWKKDSEVETASTVTEQKSAEVMEDVSFLEGEAVDAIDADMLSIPYLTLLQASSDDNRDKAVEPDGTFRNSATKENYGRTLKVVVVAITTCWTERDAGGKSVGRYEPGSIAVERDKYKMKNPATGNKIEETWVYQLVLPDYPDAGYLIYTSTPGSMSSLRVWNTQMNFLRLPSGAKAPRFSSVWEITVGEEISKVTNKKYYTFCGGGVKRLGWITANMKTEMIAPARKASQVLLTAPAQDNTYEVANEKF
jgi:hypothetical protein